MDFPKRALSQGSPRRGPRATRPGPAGMEGDDENVSPRRSVAVTAASAQGKKVLGERNGRGGWREAASPPAPQPKPAQSPPSLTGRGAGPYDPKTNYTTPRPDFLRYDPERSREILLRLEREVEAESSSGTSGTVASEAASSGSSARGSDSECDELGEEEEEVPAHRGGWARRLFLPLVAVACSFCFMHCMITTPFPASPEERLNYVGLNGSMYDAGVDQVDYFLWPIHMMGSDALREANGQFELDDSENTVHMHDKGGSPRNFIEIAMMGLADICLDVRLGEFTCQIGGESLENVDDQKEGSELGEQKTDVEEKSGVTYQEDGDSYPLPVSLEMVLEPGGKELDDGEGLRSEMLDQEAEPWEYENTAEAAKAIITTVKFLWDVMEPHLLKMLASLSAAGFMAALFKYFQRSHNNVPLPVSRQMHSAPPVQVPVSAAHQVAHLQVLAPHQAAQLPVLASPQSMQLPVFPSEQSVQLAALKEPSVSLELPVHLPSPKLDPFVSLKVPVIDHGKHDQKIQQGDASTMKASDSNSMHHKEIDSLKPPVVELLGEFSFVDAGSSRGRSNRNLDRHDGDVIIQESSPMVDVVKMQKVSSKTQSPSVPRIRNEENAATVEQMGATPTPLRRSSRLRNRGASP